MIEKLNSKKHNRKSFSCGIPELDDYLRTRANQDLKRYIAAPYVLCKDECTIIGYYTLSSISIDVGQLPKELAQKLPRYPIIPATLIGRLAVDIGYQNQKFGETLLLDALYKSCQQAHKIAAAAVIVDVKNEIARAFYEKYDFITFPELSNRMFLPMKTVKKLFI